MSRPAFPPLAVLLCLLAAPCLRGEVVSTNAFRPFSFLWFSDPHMNILKVMNGNYNTCQMREMFRDAERDPYDFAICTGDATDSRPGDTLIRMYKAMCQFSKGPVFTVPGNHDVGNHPYKDPKGREPESTVTQDLLRYSRENFGPDYFSFVHNNCAFLGFDSALFNSGLPEEAEQWKFLESELGKANAEKRTHIILFTHYTVSGNGADTWGRNLPGLAYYEMQPPARDRFLALVVKHKVQAVLSGHFHKYFNWEQDVGDGHRAKFIIAPSLAFRRPSVGYLMARVDEKGIEVEQRLISPLNPGGFGRKWNDACPPEQTNTEEWKKMRDSWKVRAMDVPPTDAELAQLSLKGPAGSEPWQPAKLPLASGFTGWADGNVGADKDLLLICPFRYSPKENGLVVLDLVSNNATDIYLNGKRVFRLGEIVLQDEGRDHHKLNRLALDPVDFADGQNHLVVLLRKPSKIRSTAFSIGMASQKNYDR